MAELDPSPFPLSTQEEIDEYRKEAIHGYLGVFEYTWHDSSEKCYNPGDIWYVSTSMISVTHKWRNLSKCELESEFLRMFIEKLQEEQLHREGGCSRGAICR